MLAFLAIKFAYVSFINKHSRKTQDKNLLFYTTFLNHDKAMTNRGYKADRLDRVDNLFLTVV